jgi:hypothetical protein
VQIQSGFARALAGYRGVGKSHFLATLGAIVSQPELRSRVTDPHVASSAQRLKRRRHPVAFVQRGTDETLLDELKNGVAQALGIMPSQLSNSAEEILTQAAKSAADLPFVVLIDTAQERENRVMRDDGILLGELANISKNLNVFLAVALDDDIAGADGVNAAISRNYTIDYLDQEHLYRVVDVHLFPKQRQRQILLHEIYQDLREVLPSFRWSEQRFSSLYPLHPFILEIAPFVRLYAPKFALLNFAAEAGNKIITRPANSLIALDEVFDKTEASLRKSPDLQDAFQTFDKLNSEVIGQIPIMQRLPARMILKALVLLSLNGDGTTASEINAAMLIYDENDPNKALQQTEELLQKFAASCPDSINVKMEQGRETRFSIKVSGKDNLLDTLNELAKTVDSSAVYKTLRKYGRENFSDWTFSMENDLPTADSIDCQVVWRGGFRRGRFIWTIEKQAEDFSNLSKLSRNSDWEVVIKKANEDISDEISANEIIPTVVWQPAELNASEIEILSRYFILLNDKSLTEKFAEQVRAAGHTHAESVKKIWKRVFLDEANLVINNQKIPFSDESKSADNLSQAFSSMLQPIFEERYPNHPIFAQNLGINEVSQLVSELFTGKQLSPQIEQLAETYALPLGLVSLRNETYVLESKDSIQKLDWWKKVNVLLEEKVSETIPLKDIYRTLKQSPLGLVHEAQHLVLSAMVANREIEFVTSKNDRIGRRSLDLQIIWDDIIGIARAEISNQDLALTNWAKILTKKDTFQSLETDSERILESLHNWLADWKKSNVLKRFEALPNEVLTTKIWKLSSHTHKTFGVVANAIELTLEESISLEEGMRRVADAFADSTDAFFQSSHELVEFEDFLNSADKRSEVWNYVALSETTDDKEIENLRYEILQTIETLETESRHDLNEKLNEDWETFYEKYREYYARWHETVMKSHHLQEKFEEITKSNEWWEFENLSRLPIFHQSHRQKVYQLYEKFKELNCNFNIREMLKTKPFCVCSFHLSDIKEWETLSRDFWETITESRKSYRKTLRILNQYLIPIFQEIAEKETDSSFIHSALKLSDIFKENKEIPLFNNEDLQVLERAVQLLPPSTIKINLLQELEPLTCEEIRERLNLRLNDLPNEQMLIKI